MNQLDIPFNKPFMTGKELDYIANSHANGQFAGDGPYTSKCHRWIEQKSNCHKALLTHSCTAALEICALLLDIKEGDEVIMPSYTFPSTANAFVLRGGIPVFIDIREDTLNLDENLLEAAITGNTKAIVPVHYAGISCEMDKILHIADKYGMQVVEDAAQGIMSTYKGQSLGTMGDYGTYSFHETKTIISGEGGALIINAPPMAAEAELIRDKGTDRSRFFRGEIDKYTWQRTGSSFLPGELTAAFLWAQLEDAENITKARIASWEFYHNNLATLEDEGLLTRPTVPENCVHNAHMYYIILSSGIDREQVLSALREKGVHAVSHYVPLHSSPAGQHFGRTHGTLETTNRIAAGLIRLPLWGGLLVKQQQYIVNVLTNVLHTT